MLIIYIEKHGPLLRTVFDGSSIKKNWIKLAYAVLLVVITILYRIGNAIQAAVAADLCQALLVYPDRQAKLCPDFNHLMKFHFPGYIPYGLLMSFILLLELSFV